MKEVKFTRICRYWEAEATPENADAYQNVALTKAIPSIEARRIPWFRHIDLLRHRLETGNVRFVTLMWSDNEADIEKFVGPDVEASYLPTDITTVLFKYNHRATHFEVVDRRRRT